MHVLAAEESAAASTGGVVVLSVQAPSVAANVRMDRIVVRKFTPHFTSNSRAMWHAPTGPREDIEIRASNWDSSPGFGGTGP